MHLFGPTGGYLFGFAAAATLTGLLCEKGWDRSTIKLTAALFAGTVIIFAGGIMWLSFFTGPMGAIQSGLIPFIPGLILKLFLALGILKLAGRYIS